ncbi:MAG: tetratricopeptide repeat protein [Phycisphaerae bacterium]
MIKVRSAFVMVLALAVGGSALGDAVNYDGMEYGDVTVNGYQDGGVSVTVKAGQRIFELSKVKWIDLSATPKMKAAEELRGRDPRGALALYREAIRGLDELELKRLAEVRAIPVAEGAGNWVEAVGYFLDVYQAQPTADVWKLRPTNFPGAGSTMMGESAALIEKRLGAFRSDEAKKHLKTFELEIYTKSNDPRAEGLARELSGVPADSGEKKVTEAAPLTVEGMVGPIEGAFTGKDFAGAVKMCDEKLGGASDALAIRLYQLKAAGLEGEGKADLAAATLLRIASFYPSSGEAPAALLVAAELEKKQNHGEEAKRLYREIVEKYPDSPAAIRAKGG